MSDDGDFLVHVARLIADHGMNIGEFYDALGCDLESCRVDAGHQIAELSGIFKGWETASNKGADE